VLRLNFKKEIKDLSKGFIKMLIKMLIYIKVFKVSSVSSRTLIINKRIKNIKDKDKKVEKVT
jgi:hypothetical protein